MKDSQEAVFYLRNYIEGCIGRARWWRDESMRANWHENMMREVREARRLSQLARRELRAMRCMDAIGPQQATLFEVTP